MIDATGQVFGHLTVIAMRSGRYTMAECVCACGGFTVKTLSSLQRGKIKSCGCIWRHHGRSRTPEYSSWNKMRARCGDPNNKDYHHYGGRGITVCDRWETFLNFLEDMGPRPPGTSIDRIDNNKGYSPDNCRWATAVEQTNNQCSNVLLTAFEETKTMAEWSRDPRCATSYEGLRQRIARGVDPESAIAVPSIPREMAGFGFPTIEHDQVTAKDLRERAEAGRRMEGRLNQ